MTASEAGSGGSPDRDDYRVRGLHIIVHFHGSTARAHVLLNRFGATGRETLWSTGLGRPLPGTDLDSGSLNDVLRAVSLALAQATDTD